MVQENEVRNYLAKRPNKNRWTDCLGELANAIGKLLSIIDHLRKVVGIRGQKKANVMPVVKSKAAGSRQVSRGGH